MTDDLKDIIFYLDTGAQRVIISHNVATTLGLDVSHPIRAEAIVTAERQTFFLSCAPQGADFDLGIGVRACSI